jgi:hypothetical protein
MVVLFGVAQAQQAIIRFDNGITVAVKTKTTPPNKNTEGYGNLYSSDNYSGNTFHRILTDINNKIYFGYDLVVEPSSEKGKYNISFKPLTKTPQDFYKNYKNNDVVKSMKLPNYEGFTARSLPEYPSGIILSDGDTMTLDILENPQTKSKISDVIVVTNDNRKYGDYFSDSKPPRDFKIEDVQFGLKEIGIYINDELYKSTRGGMSGAVIWIYIPGKGRFIMSPFEQPGYNFQKTGIIDNKQIIFDYDGDKYKFTSKDFILNYGGKWNLWVMLDTDYKPTKEQVGITMTTVEGLKFGSADSAKYLFEE